MPERTVRTQYFKFRQNNSGGNFDIDDKDGIGPVVWVEATDGDDANRRARAIGIYFDGCNTGRDCECCGDRWSPVWKGEGLPEPEINTEYDFERHNHVYVHNLDGTITRIPHYLVK